MSLRPCAQVLRKSVEPVERLDADLFATGLRIASQFLDVFDHQRPFLFLLHRLDGVSLAHDTVNRTNERWTIQRDHLINQHFAVVHRGRLLGRCPAEVAPGPHTGADRTANQTVPVQFAFHVSRVDVRRVLDGNFNRLEAPFTECFEKLGALVGEW